MPLDGFVVEKPAVAMTDMIGCGHMYLWYSLLIFSGCLFRHQFYDVVQEAG